MGESGPRIRFGRSKAAWEHREAEHQMHRYTKISNAGEALRTSISTSYGCAS
jgi:hypothetical protein